MTRTAGILILAVALTAPVARSETFPVGPIQVDIPTSKARSTCFDRADGNDLDMAACEAGEASVWDRRLNAAWARLRTVLPPADMARLQIAQRGWIAYRDQQCRIDPDAGTSGRTAAASCLLRLTATRAAELEVQVAQ